ncbi:hypothetical protein CRE_30483 [Caenorhabditis remanei]|uniref:ATP-dependent DNA helicase n=1 Tax=Caenorhabditis remanei TaxID=31234 RepID=E3NGK2_CAERE|nr:hypothetical protein CRE_30483 [Caenorhabditis remanei]
MSLSPTPDAAAPAGNPPDLPVPAVAAPLPNDGPSTSDAAPQDADCSALMPSNLDLLDVVEEDGSVDYRSESEIGVELGGIDGIEDTQLMTQESVRKRDKKKMKKAADVNRVAVKRQAESQDDREHRLKLKADATAVQRSQQSEAKKSSMNRRHSSQKATNRSQQSEEQKTSRRVSVASRAAARRSGESDDVVKERRSSNRIRNAVSRAKETVRQRVLRNAADRVQKSTRQGALLGIAASGAQPDPHYIGRMDQVCPHCEALYFKAEFDFQIYNSYSKKETTKQGIFTACCSSGAIRLENQNRLPSFLTKLYVTPIEEEPNDDDEKKKLRADAKNFRENIRQYNNSTAMACMKAEVKLPRGGPYTYCVHKQVYHLLGDLHPAPGEPRNFAQIFIIDTEQAAAELAGREMNSSCSKEIFEKLIDILKQHHPHVKSFKMMFEVEKEEKEKAALEKRPERTVKMTFQIRSQDDQRRYQNPTADEIAVVYVGDEEEIPGKRGLTVHQKSGQLQSLHVIDPNCDPMTYPLLFPKGQMGWHPKIPYARKKGNRVNVTMREFYAFNLHVRKTFRPLFRAGKLMQQYVVDVWSRVEQNRLNFYMQNQASLRSEQMSGLQDYVAGEEKGPVGVRIILPASHTGSPRDMVQKYQDAMSVVAKYGKPDFFITITCNPKWDEIQECLANGQTATDRPDVVARVFKMKIDEIKRDLFQRNGLGEVMAYIYVVEFQKRGLPHVHMLLIMKPGSKPRTAADVDRLISAEIPDKDKNPLLYELVTTMMMHRPCGVHNPSSPCMRGDVCTKKFPKEFRETTSTDNDGFSLYRRRDDGRFFEYKMGRNRVKLTNQHVVPYNSWFLMKYKCHINVEVCGAISSVKYLYKYVYKGTTRASIVLRFDEAGNPNQVIDEIKQYLDTRYVCAPEAAHHLFGFPMSERSVSVVQLPVHLPGDQTVLFQQGQEAEALARAESKNSKLTGWFEANKKSAGAVLPDGTFPLTLRDSRSFYYHEMPEHFIFNSKTGTWNSRKTKEFSIGRMYFISPMNREKFALRQLLLYTKGSTSFEDLRTVQGHKWDTFVEAARASGFLSDDTIYEQTLQEAALFHSPCQLRGLFVTLLLFETIDNAEALWDKFLDDLSEDFEHQGYSKSESEAMAYFDMFDRMEAMNEDLKKWIKKSYIRVHRYGQVIDHEMCKKLGEQMRESLNKEQAEFIDAVLNSLDVGGLFFLDGPGGSGKTYVYNCLANIIMGMKKKILTMAWVGIAAALLPNGRTVASIMKLDINNGCKTCRINLRSDLAKWLLECEFVLWDEAPMSPKASMETVDRFMREVTGIDLPFGGKVVVLGGDFRQVLPVIERGGADEQIANCISRSLLWKDFQIFHLTTNMRLTGGALDWKKRLLEIGDGKMGDPVTGEMQIPEGLESTGDLADEVFGDLLENGDVEKLAKVAILTPRNKEALEMNNSVLDKMPGTLRSYYSLDEISNKDGKPEIRDSMHFTTEFLNKMTPSGMPPHELRLKKGAIVMLLRNLDVKNSLCNGTRFVVVEMGDRVLQCKFVSGARQGQTVLIPRIKLNYEKNLPFTMSRLQFPLRLSFAMTINKSQGQTFDKIGLRLDEPIFSHGQLYVALSRTTTREGIHIQAPSGVVNNVVFKEVLL